jgi:hypothetical protein
MGLNRNGLLMLKCRLAVNDELERVLNKTAVACYKYT